MEIIKGTVANAVSYAKTIDDKAKEQIQRMLCYDLTEGSQVRIMPDVHAGKGCTIGTTMTVTDKIVPNIVGVDIGCGMYTVDLGYEPIDFECLDKAAHFVPSGMHVWAEKQSDFDLTNLYCYDKLKRIRHIELSVGTLGGGNHFIEVERASDGRYFLIIHSGSRNLGKQVAEIYQRIAIALNAHGNTLEERITEIIKDYKKAGREKDIQKAIRDAKREQLKRKIPDDLCYLSGIYMEQYLHDVVICQNFAKQNREKIAEILLEQTGLTAGEAFHTIHNYIDVGEMILRKGAIAAHKGEKILIPINMRDGSILALGKGNPNWNYSAPHGAGRVMSRTQAFHELSLENYQKEMTGIYSTSVNQSTLDEAPMAYRSLKDITDVLEDTAEIIDIMKPVYNFKADEEWKF